MSTTTTAKLNPWELELTERHRKLTKAKGKPPTLGELAKDARIKVISLHSDLYSMKTKGHPLALTPAPITFIHHGTPRSHELSPKQDAILGFIKRHIREHGYGPSVREIGEEFDIRSPNGVMCHLRALQKKGKITRAEHLSRGIQLVGKTCRCCDGTGIITEEGGPE